MSRSMVRTFGVAVILLSSVAALADTIESAEKAIIEKNGKLSALQAKVATTQNMQTPQMKYEAQSETAYECMKKADKWLYRAETKTKSTSAVGGQEQKQDGTVLIVCDGEFVWTSSDMGGQKTVMKNRPSTQYAMLTDKAYFDNLRKDYELKLLPDETVDGKATWAIQATPKQPAGEGMIAELVNYFDKDSGVNLKTVGKDSAGKVVMTSVTKDMKLNPTLAADRFVFKAPEGVQVMDMTQEQPAGEKPAAKEEPKKEEPKKEDKPKNPTPKIPKLP